MNRLNKPCGRSGAGLDLGPVHTTINGFYVISSPLFASFRLASPGHIHFGSFVYGELTQRFFLLFKGRNTFCFWFLDIQISSFLFIDLIHPSFADLIITRDLLLGSLLPIISHNSIRTHVLCPLSYLSPHSALTLNETSHC